MGRSGSLALTLAVAASLLQLLLLLPPPVSSRSARLPTNILSNAARARSLKRLTDFLKRQARHNIPEPDLFWSQHKKDDDQLGTGAATTAGLIVFNLSVGTPPAQSFTGIMDITSPLVWAQCGSCTSTSCPTFQPNKSATFSTVSCSSQTCQSVLNQTCAADDHCRYVYLFGDGVTNTSGYFANDTITFGGTPLPGMVFGCSIESAGDFYGASGVIALGRGPLSLVSQLQLSWFSYFLAPDDSDSSDTVIQLGGDAVPQTKRSRSTPLLASSMYRDLYYVNLTGIRVDGKDLMNAIPAGTFDLRADGSGGVFLSTTTPITYLEQAAYNVVRQAFVSGIQSRPVDASAAALGPDVLCYTMQSMENVRVPRLTLVFDGVKDAAAMELKTANYFFKDNTTELECLTILPSQGGSVLGSLLQTGKNMIYDIDGAKLTFETAGAAAPPPAQVSSLMIIAPCFLVLWVLLC